LVIHLGQKGLVSQQECEAKRLAVTPPTAKAAPLSAAKGNLFQKYKLLPSISVEAIIRSMISFSCHQMESADSVRDCYVCRRQRQINVSELTHYWNHRVVVS
jgi:hypothetical protein